MRPYMFALAIFFIIPAISWAGDPVVIEIITTPRGVADEVIRIDEHKHRLMEAERERIRAEKAEEARRLVLVAQRYLDNDEAEKAVEFYQKAIAADETNVDAHDGIIQARQVRDEEELKIGQQYHRAMVFLRKGLRRQAADVLVAEIKANPDNQAARDKLIEIDAER